jgi:predicted ATPase
LATALYWAAWLYQCRREGHAVQERAEALIVLSREQGLPYRLAWGTILQGWALAEQGQREEGITQIRQGLAAWRTIGVEMYQPYFLALLGISFALLRR